MTHQLHTPTPVSLEQAISKAEAYKSGDHQGTTDEITFRETVPIGDLLTGNGSQWRCSRTCQCVTRRSMVRRLLRADYGRVWSGVEVPDNSIPMLHSVSDLSSNRTPRAAVSGLLTRLVALELATHHQFLLHSLIALCSLLVSSLCRAVTR